MFEGAVGTVVQEVPSHRADTALFVLALVPWAPTVQTSVGDRSPTPRSRVSGPSTEPSCQAEPFHCSRSGIVWFEPVQLPTAQAFPLERASTANSSWFPVELALAPAT